jgi:hypothetical protein
MQREDFLAIVLVGVFAVMSIVIGQRDLIVGVGFCIVAGLIIFLAWGNRLTERPGLRFAAIPVLLSLFGFLGFRWFETSFPLAAWTWLIGGLASSLTLVAYWIHLDAE